ncbi:MAG: hypothetical protein ABIZ34_00070 [Candidatus Limnocylindrales bacterium]
MEAIERFEGLVATMLEQSHATHGDNDTKGARRAFGSTSLKTGGKIFAMLVKGRLVVKLPAKRVDELVATGLGEAFDAGHGRAQREWVSVTLDASDHWLGMAIESERFVSGTSKR